MAPAHEHDVILLVEDVASDRDLTLHELRKHGVRNTVVVTPTGAEALEYVFATGRHADRDASVPPLVMLLDLRMPDMDGVDVLRRVRGDLRTTTLPVIVLTGSTHEADLMRSFALSARFAQKPLSFHSFELTMGKLGLLRRLSVAATVAAGSA